VELQRQSGGFVKPPPLTIEEGQTTGEVVVQTKPVESETVGVLSAALWPTDVAATVTLEPLSVTLDSVSVAPSTVVGSNDATLTVILTEPALAGGLTVEISTQWNPAVKAPLYIVIPEGQTTGTVSLGTMPVTETETVYVYGRHVATNRYAELTLEPPSGNHIDSLSFASGSAVGGDLVTATVTLDQPAGSGGAVVSLASGAAAVASVPASMTVTDGNSSATFTIDTDAVMNASDVWITATYNGVVRRERLTVIPTPQTVALESISLPEYVTGGENLIGSVTLTAAAPAGGTVIALSGSRAGIATVPASVTIAQGATSATFTIDTEPTEDAHGILVEATLDGLTRGQWVPIIGLVEARTPNKDVATETASRRRRAGTGGRTTQKRIFHSAAGLVARAARETAARTPSMRTMSLIAGAEHRYYFYTPELNLLAETEVSTGSAPAIEYEYLWFNGQPVAQMSTATSDIAWYFNDPLGTPLLQTDATAMVIWRVEREPYGKIAEHREGFGRHQPLAFPGQEEQGGELAYNIHRWYRSGWGRYTQADPIGLNGESVQLYEYAHGNPHTWVDRTGLAPGDRRFGLPKDFWRWYHRQVKDPGDPDVGKDDADALYETWKASGEPDADGHRTKDEDKDEENDRCAANEDHSQGKRTLSAGEVVELVALGILGTVITVATGGRMALQPAGVIAPTPTVPNRFDEKNCPTCT
jgi:RHS repeat-associated protein